MVYRDALLRVVEHFAGGKETVAQIHVFSGRQGEMAATVREGRGRAILASWDQRILKIPPPVTTRRRHNFEEPNGHLGSLIPFVLDILVPMFHPGGGWSSLSATFWIQPLHEDLRRRGRHFP
jgi:hypothetical protein